MLPTADVIGKVQHLYMNDNPVPYLTFMNLFSQLVDDPVAVVPKEPGEGLQEVFRAACMCANVGVLDTQDRGEPRVQEFRDKIYELWRARVPAEEFALYEDVIEGRVRKERGPADHERAVQSDEASARSRQLLSKLGLAEVEEEPAAAAAAAVSAAPEVTAPRGVALQFDNIDALCAAVREGSLHTRYLPRDEARDLAHYGLDSLEVTVKLARADEHNYTVLSAGIGRSVVMQPEQTVDDIASEMGYLRMAPFAYMRQDAEFVYTLSVGPNKTNLACASQVTEAGEDLCMRLQKMHRDLGELIERLQELDTTTTLLF